MVDIKSNDSEEQQNAKTDIGAGKTKPGNKKPKRAAKGTKSPNGNQALRRKLCFGENLALKKVFYWFTIISTEYELIR